MKLGVFTVLFSDKPLPEVLDYIRNLGVEMVELGTGNYPGEAHVPREKLLEDRGEREKFLKEIEDRGLKISALSCHGNPLHPDPEIREEHRKVQRETILLANKLGVEVVITFSGCPGDHEGAKYPNWVTCPWPEDFLAILSYQWDREAIPYWRDEAEFAREQGVKIALEMHPGFLVYNPETLLKLRDACGDNIGANLDPSHLFWQGIDPLKAIRVLEGAIFHVHAKDTRIDSWNTPVNGVLDIKHYSKVKERSWVFRTVGYGHDYGFWKDFVSLLRETGYDYVLSIEHEDSLMSPREGFEKAVKFLKEILIQEKPGEMWWA